MQLGPSTLRPSLLAFSTISPSSLSPSSLPVSDILAVKRCTSFTPFLEHSSSREGTFSAEMQQMT